MLGIQGLPIVFAALLGAGDDPETARDCVIRGAQRFRDHQISAALSDFDRAVRLEPSSEPYLWQRGICHYYAGKYEMGRKQFELHKTVNPHDVENAAWHFLCAARSQGTEKARRLLIKIDVKRDPRVPMEQIYALYKGTGSADQVLAAAREADTETARMYANLYLGLYYEATGVKDQAREYIQKAARAQLRDNYMHDVARVHVRQREWDSGTTPE
jgi:lipoprotein NlpI